MLYGKQHNRATVNQFIVALVFFSAFVYSNCSASSPTLLKKDSTAKVTRVKLEAGLEQMMPYDRSRQIRTVSANLMAGAQFFRKVHLSVYGGATFTYAYGSILQWNDNFEDVAYKTSAFGAGPAFLIRIEPVLYDKLSMSADIGGACILYTNRFPHGGDVYNFMWCLGGTINYRINDKYGIGLSGKWMHVSNGQGLGPQNPSYEAAGTSVQLIRYF